MARMLESDEAARRLGVKLPTLYAYVSRGLLPSHPAPDGRRSLFAVDDVEALAKRARGARTTDTRLATVMTATTQIRDDGPWYRGAPAVALAQSASFEEVAERLWATPPDQQAAWRPARIRVPAGLGRADRLRWAVLAAGARDPLRADLRAVSVHAAARTIVSTMASVVGPPAGPAAADGGRRVHHAEPDLDVEVGDGRRRDAVATRLTRGLVSRPDPAMVRTVDAALVLLADHELAVSTMAVRVAASARADLYDAVLAGLGVLAGPLHGGASALVHRLLVDAGTLGAERAIGDALRWQRALPGFGHRVYPGEDPRAALLQALVADLAPPRCRAVIDAVRATAAAASMPAPNIDFGLGALSVATGMPEDAGRTIFAIARVAGWAAHYLEELDEAPLRYRARAVYAEGRG